MDFTRYLAMMIGDRHFAQRWFSYNNDFEVTVTYFLTPYFQQQEIITFTAWN
jgi:hypothetical protein